MENYQNLYQWLLDRPDLVIFDLIFDLKGEIWEDMGRTIPSYRNQLEGIVEELAVYRRALRGEDKIAFDDIMNKARQHASSCTLLPLFDPVDCLLLSIILEQEKEIRSLKEYIIKEKN